MGVKHGPEMPPPQGWWIATDGSGQETKEGGKVVRFAGWGAVVFRWPIDGDLPEVALHAPVVVEEWDPMWMGAREHTNNTAELSAIGEVMVWLLKEAPDDGKIPVHIRYDSEYAANMARGIWTPRANEELAQSVRELVEKVAESRVITWEHVYGHTGEHDNELADQAADLGAKRRVSEQSTRWTTPQHEVEQERDGIKREMCRRCGVMYPERELLGHGAWCKNQPLPPGVQPAIPDDKDMCRICGWMTRRGTRTIHEETCRGSGEANVKCIGCGEAFERDDMETPLLPKELRKHEKECARVPEGKAARNMEQIRKAVTERQKGGDALGRGRAGRTEGGQGSEAKAKAKAKGKGSPGPKVKAKGKGKR